MARIVTDVAFRTWSSPDAPVFDVVRNGKHYTVVCKLRANGRHDWMVTLHPKRLRTGERRLRGGPTFDALTGSAKLSAAWYKHVDPCLGPMFATA